MALRLLMKGFEVALEICFEILVEIFTKQMG